MTKTLEAATLKYVERLGNPGLTALAEEISLMEEFGRGHIWFDKTGECCASSMPISEPTRKLVQKYDKNGEESGLLRTCDYD